MKFNTENITDDQHRQTRNFLCEVPDEAERRQMERASGLYFPPDLTRIEALTSKLHVMAATGDPEAKELLPVFTDFVQWLQQTKPEEDGDMEISNEARNKLIIRLCDIIDALREENEGLKRALTSLSKRTDRSGSTDTHD